MCGGTRHIKQHNTDIHYMKKLISYLFVGLVAAASAVGTASCSDDEECPALPADFKVSKENVVFLKSGGEEIFYVSAAGTPAVSADAEWVTAAVARNGKSNSVYAVTLTAQPNTLADIRTAGVKVAFGGQEATVTVTQSLADDLAVAVTEYTVPQGGGIIEVAYKSTGEVAVETPDWISLQQDRAMSDYTLKLKVEPNMGEAREGKVIVATVADAAVKVELTVKQEAYSTAGGIGETAKQAAANMYAGWNLGNTLECPGGETAWGNPKTTKAMIDMVKNAGFNALRLPTAWHCHLVEDAEPWTIDPEWLARVKEVVNYGISNDMYVIVNDHWDNGWLEINCNAEAKDAVVKKEKAIWTQIANYFADYGEKLIFAGNNEMRNKRSAGENWGEPNAEEADAMNAYNQAFIDAVRATGGNNAVRNIVVQSWCCNPWRLLDNSFVLPTDPATDHLMLECHFYDPQSFTHWSSDKPAPKPWGKRAGFTTDSDSQEDYVDNIFGQLKTKWVDAGYPIILGEYGTNAHTTSDQTLKDSEKYYLEYVTKAAKTNGLVPFYWDNASPGVGSFGIFNRSALMVGQTHFLEGIMQGAADGQYPF